MRTIGSFANLATLAKAIANVTAHFSPPLSDQPSDNAPFRCNVKKDRIMTNNLYNMGKDRYNININYLISDCEECEEKIRNKSQHPKLNKINQNKQFLSNVLLIIIPIQFKNNITNSTYSAKKTTTTNKQQLMKVTATVVLGVT